MIVRLIALFIVSCHCAATAETAYVQVVDDGGAPIPGATVSVYWFEGRLFSGKIRGASGNFTCNGRGVASIRLNGKIMVVPDRADKGGYIYERYMNRDRTFLSGDKDTKSNPRRMVLRRPEPASFLLELEGGGIQSSRGGAIGFGVDLFRKLRRQTESNAYDDFFVSAVFNETGQFWTTTFWTTNANCGLVATADRRFTAPSSGYTDRVEVSQETITNRAFTLYLKTRVPAVYAMIPFGLNDLEARGSVGLQGPLWDFKYTVARINPYGGRELERDGRTGGIHNDLRQEALRALLVERKYPPVPDIDARLQNYKKRNELLTKMRELRTKDTQVRREIEMIKTSMKGEPKSKIDKAYEKQQKWIKETDGIFREYRKELIRLEKEAHTLNLPEESRKDKEDK